MQYGRRGATRNMAKLSETDGTHYRGGRVSIWSTRMRRQTLKAGIILGEMVVLGFTFSCRHEEPSLDADDSGPVASSLLPM